MTYMAPELNQRGNLQKVIMTAAAGGKMLRTYSTVASIWCGLKTLHESVQIRYQEIGLGITTEITVRKSAIDQLGSAFSSGFDTGIKTMADIQPAKSDWFFFVNDRAAGGGRLFQIKGFKPDEKNFEFVKLMCQPIEEQNTGATP